MGRALIIIENKIDNEDWSVMNMYKTNNSIKIHKAKAIAMQGEIARAYQ